MALKRKKKSFYGYWLLLAVIAMKNVCFSFVADDVRNRTPMPVVNESETHFQLSMAGVFAVSSNFAHSIRRPLL